MNRFRLIALFLGVLFSTTTFGAFQGDWAATDLYAFLGVKQGATTSEVIAAFTEAADELAAAERAGLNVHPRRRALTNARNILVEEHSRSVYNAYLEACRADRISPGTADQQQQMMAAYLQRHRNVSIASHRELFPKFHRSNPATKFPATDFTLQPVVTAESAEVETPLVEPEPTTDNPACGLKLSTYRRLVLILFTATLMTTASPHQATNNAVYRHGQAGVVRDRNPPVGIETAQRPAPAVEAPAPAPVTEAPAPAAVPPAKDTVAGSPRPTPPTAPQPTAAEAPRTVSPERGAADRGQGFRNRLLGNPR